MHDGSASSRSKTAPGSVALYLRVSTEEQRERQSIDTQREFGAKYTDLHELKVQQVYADDGISGTVPLEKRPEGHRVLQAARRGEFNQLLIYKLDRLGRDTRLTLNAVAELEKHGVHVRSMTEKFDTGSVLRSTSPAGQQSNWVPTSPSGCFEVFFRLTVRKSISGGRKIDQ